MQSLPWKGTTAEQDCSIGYHTYILPTFVPPTPIQYILPILVPPTPIQYILLTLVRIYASECKRGGRERVEVRETTRVKGRDKDWDQGKGGGKGNNKSKGKG